MHLDDYVEVVATDDIRVKGTRVGIETVLYDYIHRSRTPEQIAASYPALSLEQIYATILYYLRHRDEIDSYLTAWLEYGYHMRQQQARDPQSQEFLARLRQASRIQAGEPAGAARERT